MPIFDTAMETIKDTASKATVWAKEAASKTADGVKEVIGGVTGSNAVLKTEQFHKDMEAVYAALVIRVVTAEERIEHLEQERKWTRRIAIVGLVLAVAALAILIRR